MNRNIFKSILMIVTLIAIGTANATTVTLKQKTPGKKLDIGDTGIVPTTLVSGGSTFSDDFYFRAVSNSEATVSIAGFGIPNLSAELIDITHPHTVNSGLSFMGSLTGGDHYALDIFGTASSSPPGGLFSGAVYVTPIPAAAWLLLSGLVGVGAMARRRKGEE
jgi:hypothetical protein